MVRHFVAAAAAIILTGTAVAALAETPDTSAVTVSVNKAGEYCVQSVSVTGSRLPRVHCMSQAEWAKQGVTFARR